MELYDSIDKIKGIGEKKKQCFNRLGVFTIYDLLSFFPRRYEDRTKYKPISLISNGEYVCISAIIATEPQLVRLKKGLEIVKFSIADESGKADVVFFHQPFIRNALNKGDEVVFYGKVEVDGNKRSLVNPVFEKEEKSGTVTGKILPIYPLTSGLTQKAIYQAMESALIDCKDNIPEIIHSDIIRKYKFMSITKTYENIHFPSSFEGLENARKRIVYEELLVLSLALSQIRNKRTNNSGIRMYETDMSIFLNSLPFEITGAQSRAISDAITDMQSGNIMSRLIQGDVGSGKTLIAAALIYFTFMNGYMSAFMAPTEILAEQHYKTLTTFLSPFGIRISLLTGTSSDKAKIKNQIINGETDLIVGTHALISKDVQYKNLGLVITDEQHRFGVEQRTALSNKGAGSHVLVMSATPIPRSLALIIYGELDVSIVDELPPGREKVDTFAVNSSYRERLNAFILKQVKEGHQVFVVCPKVEEDEQSNLLSAEAHSRTIAEAINGISVGCVHGKMKTSDKERVMEDFSQGKIDVLVSTTVIEVGVDVPNATLMIIENAERFGLSQLHQLRGRVGRGKNKSYCILVSDATNEETKSRLKIMTTTNDGFKIAEEDLRLRGPGDFFGNRQHGLPQMHLADLGTDTRILKAAQTDADEILKSDPYLKEHELLRDKVKMFFDERTSTFN